MAQKNEKYPIELGGKISEQDAETIRHMSLEYRRYLVQSQITDQELSQYVQRLMEERKMGANDRQVLLTMVPADSSIWKRLDEDEEAQARERWEKQQADDGGAREPLDTETNRPDGELTARVVLFLTVDGKACEKEGLEPERALQKLTLLENDNMDGFLLFPSIPTHEAVSYYFIKAGSGILYSSQPVQPRLRLTAREPDGSVRPAGYLAGMSREEQLDAALERLADCEEELGVGMYPLPAQAQDQCDDGPAMI